MPRRPRRNTTLWNFAAGGFTILSGTGDYFNSPDVPIILLSAERNLVYMISREELQKTLEGADYIYAKTMPQCPHYYTLRAKWTNKEVGFDDAVTALKFYSVPDRWENRKVMYFKTNTHRYWVMSERVEDVILINRAVEPEAVDSHKTKASTARHANIKQLYKKL
jgi:hypothetical protein